MPANTKAVAKKGADTKAVPKKGKAAPAKAAKPAAKAAAKGAKAKAPAKGSAKGAKAVVRTKTSPTIISPARVKQWINTRGINNDIHKKREEFSKKHLKTTTNKDVVAIKKDEDLVKKFRGILKPVLDDMPKNLDTKEKKEKWRATRLAQHKKNVEAAIKKDSKLAIYAKDYQVHELLHAMNSDMKRFSRGSYVVIAAILDEIITSILRTAMTIVVGHNKSLLTRSYCVTHEMENNPYYSLFCNIKPYVEAQKKLRESAEHQDDATESEAPKKGKKAKAAPPADEDDDDEDEADAEVAPDADAKEARRFPHYVGNIARTLIKNPDKKNPFTNVRITSDVKVFCSDIIICILTNLGVALTHLMRNAKTINEELIRNAFATVLTYNGVDPSSLMACVDKALASMAKAKPAKKAAAKTADADVETEEADDDDDEDDDDEESESEEESE